MEIESKGLTDEELAQRLKLPVSQIGELREIFRLVDKNGSGCIDISELRQFVENLRIDNSEYADELVAKARVFREGQSVEDGNAFSFEDLISSMLVRPQVSYTRESLRAAFEIIAGRGGEKGEINIDRLSHAIHHGAGGMDPAVAGDLMAMLDGNIGGRVDYEEIIDLMMGADPNAHKTKLKRVKLTTHQYF